jgi:hypothetical protein
MVVESLCLGLGCSSVRWEAWSKKVLIAQNRCQACGRVAGDLNPEVAGDLNPQFAGDISILLIPKWQGGESLDLRLHLENLLQLWDFTGIAATENGNLVKQSLLKIPAETPYAAGLVWKQGLDFLNPKVLDVVKGSSTILFYFKWNWISFCSPVFYN